MSRGNKPRLHVYLARLIRVAARFPDPACNGWEIPAVLWKVGVSYQPEKRTRNFPYYWPRPCNFYLRRDRLYVTELLSNSEARALEQTALSNFPWNLPENFPTCCESITELRVSRTKGPPEAFVRPLKDMGMQLVRLK